MDAKKELIKLVRELSYQKRRIVLASGRESDFYIDMKNTLLHQRGITLVANWMAHELQSMDGRLAGVGGITMGADPLSTGVSLVTQNWKRPLHAFYIRKEPKTHGTSQWIEGAKNFRPGDKVYILEDVVTTGGSSLKAVERARDGGLEVLGIFTCVDREEGGRETIEAMNLEFRTLLRRSEIEATPN